MSEPGKLVTVNKPRLTVTDPPDFSEGGAQHRRSILASTALIVVLLLAKKVDPVLFGVQVAPCVLWAGLLTAHLYFFLMWRLTSTIEADQDKKFWNLRGLCKQTILGGTKNFPGKLKAQIFFIRALPIWAFVLGLAGGIIGIIKQ